ncbi:MAG: hypothetical protein EBT92_05375 [Planctomycetes bacterium]|nr:hypothetical protein [Planctomycetota bacterium]NBY03239.1 hypothetical protein [Planctomycetota bacterium]
MNLALRTLSLVLIGLTLCCSVLADIVILKDGFVLQGMVKRESVTEFDPVSKEPVIIPKGFYMVDDGVRRIYFNPNLVRTLDKRDPIQEEKWIHNKPIYIPNGKGPPPFLAEVESTDWDSKWERTFKYRSPVGLVGVFQHISNLSSYAIRVDATSKFVWSSMYLTQEIGSKKVISLIKSHPDFQNTDKVKPEEMVSRRFKLVDFLAQAGWFEDSEKELKSLANDFPEHKERTDKAREVIESFRGRERLEKIKRIIGAGRLAEARKQLDSFPIAEAKDKILTEIQSLQSKLEKAQEQFLLAQKNLVYLSSALSEKKADPILIKAVDNLQKIITEESVERLDAFLSISKQKNNDGPMLTLAELEKTASLAISGWVMGNSSADPNPISAKRLWQTRTFIIDFIKADNSLGRKTAFDSFLNKYPAAKPEEVGQVLLQTILPIETNPSGKVFEKELKSGKSRGSKYSMRYPADVNPNRLYPLLIVFPGTNETVDSMLEKWAPLADEYGFILLGYHWQIGGIGYGFSDKEHFAILDILRDARLNSPVDPDKVFLFGYEQGAAVAFDVGLSHPDQFAGIIPMCSTVLDLFIEKYWRNGQYLPFYVVNGDRAGDTNLKTRQIFTNWMPRGYPSLWIQYKGRGIEFFRGELPLICDWMRGKSRVFPMNQLGSDGGGSILGNEFQSSRFCDNQFYWIGSDTINENKLNYPQTWKPNLQPASFFAKSDVASNIITIKTYGMKNYYLLFGKNSKGESQIDFDKPVSITSNLISKWNGKVSPSLETLMETFLETGDRKNHVYAKVLIKP